VEECRPRRGGGERRLERKDSWKSFRLRPSVKWKKENQGGKRERMVGKEPGKERGDWIRESMGIATKSSNFAPYCKRDRERGH